MRNKNTLIPSHSKWHNEGQDFVSRRSVIIDKKHIILSFHPEIKWKQFQTVCQATSVFNWDEEKNSNKL